MIKVIKIGATWCQPCLQTSEVLRQIESENPGSFELVSIDVDDEPDVSVTYSVRSIPTVIVIDESGELCRLTGAQPKQKYLNAIVR